MQRCGTSTLSDWKKACLAGIGGRESKAEDKKLAEAEEKLQKVHTGDHLQERNGDRAPKKKSSASEDGRAVDACGCRQQCAFRKRTVQDPRAPQELY